MKRKLFGFKGYLYQLHGRMQRHVPIVHTTLRKRKNDSILTKRNIKIILSHKRNRQHFFIPLTFCFSG